MCKISKKNTIPAAIKYSKLGKKSYIIKKKLDTQINIAKKNSKNIAVNVNHIYGMIISL